MKKIKRVYVAGPLTPKGVTGENLAIEYLGNVRRLIQLALKCMEGGFSPFCPGIDFQYFLCLNGGMTINEAQIKSLSLDWLEASDAVLLSDGWQSSAGTLFEIKWAEMHGIPVFHSMNELHLYAEASNEY